MVQGSNHLTPKNCKFAVVCGAIEYACRFHHFQADEVEALTAIYGDDLRVVDEANRVYIVDVCAGDRDADVSVSLQVRT